MASFVAFGDVVIASAALVGGIYLEKNFAIYDKVMAAYDWIKAKF